VTDFALDLATAAVALIVVAAVGSGVTVWYCEHVWCPRMAGED
jgi:hypothetical protein